MLKKLNLHKLAHADTHKTIDRVGGATIVKHFMFLSMTQMYMNIESQVSINKRTICCTQKK